MADVPPAGCNGGIYRLLDDGLVCRPRHHHGHVVVKAGSLSVVLLLFCTHAHSETVWDNPGEAPFGGTPSEAALALAQCGAPYAAVAQLAYRVEIGGCQEGEVQDGDTFELMLFSHGCLRNVVARIDGSPGWVGKSRKKLVCRDQWGHHFIIPAACHNGAYNFIPPAIQPPPEALWVYGYPGGAGASAAPADSFVSYGPSGFLGVSGNGVAVPIGGGGAPGTSPILLRTVPALSGPISEAGRPSTGGRAPGSESGPSENTQTPPQPVSEPWAMPLLGLAVVIVIALRRRSRLSQGARPGAN